VVQDNINLFDAVTAALSPLERATRAFRFAPRGVGPWTLIFAITVHQETFSFLRIVSTRAKTSSAAVIGFPANIALYSSRIYSSAFTRLSLVSKIRGLQSWAAALGTGVEEGNGKILPAFLGWSVLQKCTDEGVNMT
jgi:hypothetical protein